MVNNRPRMGIAIGLFVAMVVVFIAAISINGDGQQITISCMDQNAHIRYIEDSIVLDSTGAVSCFISKK